MLILAVLVACTPAPVPLNPNKRSNKLVKPEVDRDTTMAVAPESVVHKRDGSTIDLATLWDKDKDQKVVVVFYRGGWCHSAGHFLGPRTKS